MFAHLFREPKYLPPEEFRAKRERDLLQDSQRRYQEQKALIDQELARRSRQAKRQQWVGRAKKWADGMDLEMVGPVLIAFGIAAMIGWVVNKNNLSAQESHPAGNPWTAPGKSWYVHAHGKDVTWHDREYGTAAECDADARTMTIQMKARVVFRCEER